MRNMIHSTRTCLLALAWTLALVLPVSAQSGSRTSPPIGSGRRAAPRQTTTSTLRQPAPGSGQRAKPAPLALEGYSAVSIHDARQWVRGTPEHQLVFDGHTYYFPTEQEKQAFSDRPSTYVPVLGGDCVVALAKMGKRIPGNIRSALFHDRRLFLFANDKAKQMFAAQPQAYANADLAFGGHCPVCRLDMRQAVPGKPDLTVYYTGLRYRFPTDKQRALFLANPEKYQDDGSSHVSAVQGSRTRAPMAGSGRRPAPVGSGSRGSSAGSGSR